MNLFELTFILQLLILLGIFFVKLWNIMSSTDFKCKIPFNLAIIWLVGSFLSYTVGIITSLLYSSDLLMTCLMFIETPIFFITFALFIVELGYNMAVQIQQMKPTEAHKSVENKLKF